MTVPHTFTIAGNCSRCCKATHRRIGIKRNFECLKAVRFGSRHHWISTHKACPRSSSKIKMHRKFIKALCRQRNYLRSRSSCVHLWRLNFEFKWFLAVNGIDWKISFDIWRRNVQKLATAWYFVSIMRKQQTRYVNALKSRCRIQPRRLVRK